jgi:predicted ATPase
VLEAMLSILLGMAATSPVLLMVEDVHWADRATSRFLDSLVDLAGELLINKI